MTNAGLEAMVEHLLGEARRGGAAISIWVRPTEERDELNVIATVTASHGVNADDVHEAVRDGVKAAVADYLAKVEP